MADLSITAASVVPGTNARIRHGTAGATITAGQVVYLDTSDNRYKLADSDAATGAVRGPAGIALNGASAGQPVALANRGDVTLGEVMTAGNAYYLSDTAGGICPFADLATGDYPVVLGIAKSASVLSIGINAAGVAL